APCAARESATDRPPPRLRRCQHVVVDVTRRPLQQQPIEFAQPDKIELERAPALADPRVRPDGRIGLALLEHHLRDAERALTAVAPRGHGALQGLDAGEIVVGGRPPERAEGYHFEWKLGQL